MPVRGLPLLLLAMLGVLSCQSTDGFQCRSNDACSNGGIAGLCQDTGYCSFPDPDCASGQRYGDLAEMLAQECVPPSGDTDAGGECGDGVLDPGESCDGSDIGDATCSSEGFASGAVSCTDTCEFDTSNCSQCGNGSVDPDEQCDGANLGAVGSCADVGLGDASELLSCTSSCQLDYGACSSCGDGQVTAPEECDGDVADISCNDAGVDGEGAVGCSPGCTLDTSACGACGNGVAEDGEACDGADLGGAVCEDLEGFSGGALGCGDDCTFDPQNCSICGDGAIQEGEPCDGLDLGDASCESLGYSGGELGCWSDCYLDVSACDGKGRCGNNQIDPGEACDGGVGDETCLTINKGIGPLTCDRNCGYDTSQCSLPATISASATGIPTSTASITLSCDDGSDTCNANGSWANLVAGCVVTCGTSNDVTVSVSYPEGDFTVPQTIDYGALLELACAGSNPCTLTRPSEDGLSFAITFVAIG